MGNFSDRIFDRKRRRLNAPVSFSVPGPRLYVDSKPNRAFGGQQGTPDPKLKGKHGGNCNITACQKPGAYAWSMNNQAFYCDDCARKLNWDVSNQAYYKERYGVNRFVFRLDTVTQEEREKWESKGAYIPDAP